MNFLAHLYLSGDNHEIIIGNFIADHVKGNSVNLYQAGIRSGIALHRSIDSFTDNHLVVRAAVEKLRPGYRKYAGVILDMYFDHFLAVGWNEWSAEPLKQFTSRMYEVLSASYQILPARTRHMLPHMVKHDWLFNYSQFEGLHLALSGMAHRTPFMSKMETAVDKLIDDYAFYQDSFRDFFPDLKDFASMVRGKIEAEGIRNS